MPPTPTPTTISVADIPGWSETLRTSRRPVLVHLNADTTWLLQLPRPDAAGARTHFNILVDPWLRGPQSDVASWFSTQWHVVAPAVDTLAGLNRVLAAVETGTLDAPPDDAPWHVDAVAVSHEFTDHCHRETLTQLPPSTVVFAADQAADLIRSWGHFDAVTTAPGFARDVPWDSIPAEEGGLPSWLRIARVITDNDALYYHSALVVAFASADGGADAEAVVYSPHGIQPTDLSFLPGPASGLSTLALLHGMHDVRIALMKQLNLGALNGVDAVRAARARYWVSTHDEIKTGGGVIAPLLLRTQYTLEEAKAHDEKSQEDGQDVGEYSFLELRSGEGAVLV